TQPNVFANNSSCSLFGYKRNLKALFCLVISNHLTLIANTSSLFVYCTISFGYRQPTFISHLLIGLSPFTFLEDGRLLSEKVKKLTAYMFFQLMIVAQLNEPFL